MEVARKQRMCQVRILKRRVHHGRVGVIAQRDQVVKTVGFGGGDQVPEGEWGGGMLSV